MKYILLLLLSLLVIYDVAFAQSRGHAESSMTLHLDAVPAAVLPLFGPVRESEWSPHWNPQILYPADRRQQAGCVFSTGAAIWVMTVYDEIRLLVSYVIATSGESAAQLDIVLRAAPGNTTQATITHRATSLSETHDQDVVESIRAFPEQRAHWEHAINARLRELHTKEPQK